MYRSKWGEPTGVQPLTGEIDALLPQPTDFDASQRMLPLFS
jgi:hypothetical protein